jgi:hypothetical protein
MDCSNTAVGGAPWTSPVRLRILAEQPLTVLLHMRRFVPPTYQVLFANMVALVWNVYFSFATRPKAA